MTESRHSHTKLSHVTMFLDMTSVGENDHSPGEQKHEETEKNAGKEQMKLEEKEEEEEDDEEEEEEEEDPFYKRIENSGCSKQHYALQDCFDEKHDWRKCTNEMKNFKKCMDEQLKLKKIR